MKEPSRALDLMRILATIILLCCPGFLWAAADTHYVSLDGGNIPPYTNGWESAATNIQDAIIASTDGDTVLVSNGVYQTGGVAGWPNTPAPGGLLTNRVAVTKSITVQSLNNDPTNTIIKGAGPCGPNAIRGVYLRGGSSKLVGFTVTGGATLTTGGDYEDKNGGGVNGSGIISNCIIIGNAGYAHGGGAVYITVYNSQIISNSSVTWGGGQSQGKIYNSIIRHNTGSAGAGTWGATLSGCTVANNVGAGAWYGSYSNCLIYGNDQGVYLKTGVLLETCTIVGNSIGVYTEGAVKATILNSIIYSNTANWVQNDTCVIAFTNTCTIPTNAVWTGGNNITNNPLFVAFGNGYKTNHVPGNYRLQAKSPCVNAGLNQNWMTGAVDLDGKTRVRYGTVDMGAYELINKGTIVTAR